MLYWSHIPHCWKSHALAYLPLDICGYAGVELTVEGDCRPCERGFYKSESSQIACDTCPLGYTTLASGATHIGMCSYGRYTRT